ncbi:hypothetical protein V2S66_32510 [Streptomyces sp. V4-01]|uniref:Uncharacterized protein n=1 Tax=Actinacidiphila polyblastidii TaxID=3110430 RepID=A0ABU7PLF8_9ACTN|nr:hypothetical protein [Streptomyces sp. V4-01]
MTDHDAHQDAYRAHDDGAAPESAPESAERELRALLERAVPQLPAPAQRLESVRERVRRRRRRRAAGTSLTAVLAIAAAGLLLPGLGDRDGGGRLDATSLAPPASGSAPTASGGAPAEGATAPPGSTTVPFPDVAGLQVVMPQEWNALTASDDARGYVSTQTLGLPEGGCAHQLDDFCTPLDRTLAKDGVLVQFTLSFNKATADKLRVRGSGMAVAAEPVVDACHAVGGTEQLGTTIVDGSGSGVVVVATACLSHPRGRQEARVRTLLSTTFFS